MLLCRMAKIAWAGLPFIHLEIEQNGMEIELLFHQKSHLSGGLEL